ncbi:MAG: hypothetical protein LBL47_02160 [Lactobacillus sp.]|nr:hypothetical protein [Lactobacillus sp.]
MSEERKKAEEGLIHPQPTPEKGSRKNTGPQFTTDEPGDRKADKVSLQYRDPYDDREDKGPGNGPIYF